MKQFRFLSIFCLALSPFFAGTPRAATLFDQNALLYNTNYVRGVNWQSQGGVPLSNTAGTPTGSSGTAPGDPTPTFRQFQGGIVYGAVSFQRKTNLNPSISFPANARNLEWPHTENADSSVALVMRAQAGAPYMMKVISFFFGAPIPVPLVREDGTLLSESQAKNYWAAEPVTSNDHANTGYYWSPHANTVYAIQPGRVDITWRRAAPEPTVPANPDNYALVGGNYFLKFSTNYTVSGATFKTPRKIFWTEKAFQRIGKPIHVPTARVGALNIVYQNEFPERVSTEYVALGQSELVAESTNRLQELRTLWYDRTDSQIHAYNKEGRVFVELLGDLRSGTTRHQLGYEIVDVVRQASPADVTIDLGERLTPPEVSGSAGTLHPEPILSDLTKNFAFQQNVDGGHEVTLWATRETKNLNDYQVFWMEESVAGLRWPFVLARYQLVWPTDAAKYSHYIRPAGDRALAIETAVSLPTENVPIIDWQDRDGEGDARAFLTEDFKFYSYLDNGFPAHRTLLRFTSGDNIAFERVFSWLDTGLKTGQNLGNSVATALDIWDSSSGALSIPDAVSLKAPRVVSANVLVGQRLVAPDQELRTDSDGLYLAGSIRQSQGTGYSVSAYKDPFAFGFEEAARGAIIPVNGKNNDARLEVWWYRKNAQDLAKGFKPIYWPSVIGRYTIQWPIAMPYARDLILASNDGSGPLTSLEARGTIYFQNDRALPGYNPNEEHALMLGGQAYALRDDLNITSGQEYSSHPYVLLEYTDADGRPSMSVFQVLREKGDIRFDYTVNAGTVLQPPMPLPFLEKPLAPKVIGAPARSLNTQVGFWPVSSSTQNAEGGVSNVRITTQTRHFFQPYQALVLQDVPSGGAVTSRWFYTTNVDQSAHQVEGFVSQIPPHSLSGWPSGDQPAEATRFRYGIANTQGLSNGDKVVIARSGEAKNWVVTVSSTGATVNGTFVEVEFGLNVPTAATGADRLIKPLTNVTENQFAPPSWRLAFQPVSPGISDSNLREFYAGFTLQDRKRDLWVYRGPHDPTDPADNPQMVMKFYYKTLPGFYFPSRVEQPAVGTITPYLRPRNADGTFAGESVRGDANNDGHGDDNPLGIIYRPAWPEGVPVLQMAESLTEPKRGLPAIRGQRSLEIVYQQSQLQAGNGLDDRSAVLHDPTREKVFELGPETSTTDLGKIPDSVKTSEYRGKTYFPNLPAHLSERFFFDPNRGSNGALVLLGQFFDEAVGDDYLLLNVLGDKDTADLRALCLVDDPKKGLWDKAITNGLQTVMELFVENPARPGTFVPSSPEEVGPTDLAEVKDDDVAVDSYALTAVGPGTGYVSLLAGNGFNTDVQPADEPVAVQILRVVDKLYPGELKIVQSSNPLAEKLTLQQVVDLAGQVEEYEFEWMIAPPVDGQPTAVYQNTRQLLLGDVSWNHIRFPLSSDVPSGLSESGTPSSRRSADVNGSVVALSRIPFESFTIHDGKLNFKLGSGSLKPAPQNKVVVRYEDGTELNATIVRASEGADTLAAQLDAGEAFPAGNLRVIDLYERTVADQPQSIVFREFSVDNQATYSQYYLSLDLDPALAAKVYINGSLAVSANLAEGNSSTVAAPNGFNTLPRVYRLGQEMFSGGIKSGGSTTHRIAVELFSQALPNIHQAFNLRLEAYEAVDLAGSGNSPWLPLSASQYQDKVRAIIGENADVKALSDNYLISRYRAVNSSHASFQPDINGVKQGWSQWTEPQLAEGWIKRVLAGINPFNQRVTDLFNNRVNSDVSILTQAGERWEGDVALNLDSINDAGLIEIYETVLNRGKMLSIGSGINFGPANDALLLAAGYLNDLYMMLGNEAWADAANPTIGIGTKDQTYGEIATALFAFKGQTASLLDEELALLRGRDDFLVPGVTTRPVYNRLFWNYTRGIESGEAIYALNYNIQENNDSGVDGLINAEDARKMFPQGHGDAYGHYLTALKGYYSLLLDNNFDWVPRIEAVTVLGKPVSVDYQDERKFAAAAAAAARSGRQIFDLTWRKDFIPGEDAGWRHFGTNRVNTSRLQPVPRMWGLDHWASRTAQGAYLNWALGNAILPDVDPDPTHEGIQKVDRTTVPELKELATTAEDLQTALDNAEAHLTPLGMASGSLAFDINPTQITGANAQTHFEQIYARASAALNNATAAFDDAKDVTRLMRSEQDSLAELQTSIGQKESAYTTSLIEIYGTPYPEDIGPGKTYKQGYTGPDLIHYIYVDNVESSFNGLLTLNESQSFRIDVQDLSVDWIAANQNALNPLIRATDATHYSEGIHFIEFNLDPSGLFDKPEQWSSRRQSPGKIQQAVSRVLSAHFQLGQALGDAEGAKSDLDDAIAQFRMDNELYESLRKIERDLLISEEVFKSVEFASEVVTQVQEAYKTVAEQAQEALIEGMPRFFVAGLASGGDFTAPARAAMRSVKGISEATFEWVEFLQFFLTKGLELSTESARRWTEFDVIGGLNRQRELQQALYELSGAVGSIKSHYTTINERLREVDDARRSLQALVAEGERIQAEREIFRQRAAALIQGFRTRDAAFRIFRNEKLERYKTLFDLAARYTFLAANAYDYETGLLHQQQGKEFINRIVNSRALGVMRDGQPQFAGSNTGDPGLSSVLAEMMTDFEVLKGRLGFNNPNAYGTTVSLRMEKERIIPAADGHTTWQDVLERGRRANLLDDEDVRRHCMQIERGNGLPVPGIILEFSTTIEDGLNLFGKGLAGGDHYFDTSLFATKIFGVGVALEGYIGMDNPVANSTAVTGAGGYSPPDPETTFLGSLSLAATPGIYLIPVGVDSMRSPALGDVNEIRSWNVNDVAIPLPFNIGGSDFSTKPLWQSSESLTEPLFAIRKHQAFRPVSTTAAFSSSIYGGTGSLQLSQYTNNRLIGRSVWNTKWKLVIPGHKLLADPIEGLDRFTQTVKDVKLHFVTYSYAGN